MESCHMLPFTHVVRQKRIKHWSNFMCFGRRIFLKKKTNILKSLWLILLLTTICTCFFPNPFKNFEITYKNMDLFFKTSQKTNIENLSLYHPYVQYMIK